MTENPGPGRGPLRIGDAERERAVAELGEHFAAGRLSEEEHSERADQAYQAKTQADLDALFDDLPHDRGPQDEQEQKQWGPPWAQHRHQGPPPWAAAWGGGRGRPPFGRGLRWLPVPFLVLAAIGTACALAHGFFPFFALPLLVLAVTFFVIGKRGHFGPPRQRNHA